MKEVLQKELKDALQGVGEGMVKAMKEAAEGCETSVRGGGDEGGEEK